MVEPQHQQQAKSQHGGGGGGFSSTRWSVVLAAVDRTSPQSAKALSTLCSIYWYPLYAFVRRQGHSAAEAEDLTQEFFARVLEKHYLDAVVGPEKGKFRTFLLVCLKRFLANEWDRARALKRGGGKATLSIDFRDADDRYLLEPAHGLTPERLFERRWALTVLQQALARLAEEMKRAGKERLFEQLKVYLVADHTAPPHADTAAALGMTEGAVKVAVYRLRERYRTMLRQEIVATLGDPADADAEIRELFEALAPSA